MIRRANRQSGATVCRRDSRIVSPADRAAPDLPRVGRVSLRDRYTRPLRQTVTPGHYSEPRTQHSGLRTQHSGLVVAVSPCHAVRRRGIILPLALIVIGLLALLAARVVFRSNADISAVQATETSLQARLAAQAGIQKALSVLQGCADCQASTTGPTGMDLWYNNPDAFNAVIVQTQTGNYSSNQAPSTTPGSQNPATWRFSVVGNDPLAQPNTAVIRYGLTDESSKLNLNMASQTQLATLISLVVHDMSVDPEDLAKAIVYYRRAAGQPDQTEDTYYASLDPPYVPRHASFESVEELLLVRGMTGRILYGEDWNRNGILDPEENDGDTSFPPDNGDSVLDRGLYPYLTVWSSEPNLDSRNQSKINLNSKDAQALANAAFLTPEQKADISLRTQNKSINSVLELLQPRPGATSTPFTKEDLPMLLDEFTTSSRQTNQGLINVNTAPAEVLEAIGFTDQEAHQIITVRAGLSPEDRSSVAWLIDQGVIDTTRYAELASRLTAKAFQFHVESVGFADHVGTFCRLEAIVKMQSPLPVPQVVYWRDLSSLGIGWPVRSQEGSTFVVTHNG